jgi:hypothetical protein
MIENRRRNPWERGSSAPRFTTICHVPIANTKEKQMKKVIFGAVLALASTATLAQTAIGPVHITQVVTGWGTDHFSVNIDGAIPNPAGCGAIDLAGTGVEDPGYKTFYAAALTAMSTDKTVLIVVSNSQCSGVRPKLIGITINRS